jgi:hypothetical protein
MNVYEKLSIVQSKLKVSKDNFNSFGNYKYRSCEDILEGAKPLLKEVSAIVTLTDTVELIGDRFYIKATATFIDTEKGETVSVNAFAREDVTKKGMDLAQVTGSVSSYARKYALNGLFCIDDTKDSDATNKHGGEDTDNTHSDDIGGYTPPKAGKPQDKPQQEQTATGDIISKPQANRIYALSGGNADICKEVLKTFGYAKSDEVQKKYYEAICKAVQEVAAKADSDKDKLPWKD